MSETPHAEHAHILEVYAERVERRYTPVKVVADDNKRFAAALRSGAAALRQVAQAKGSDEGDAA